MVFDNESIRSRLLSAFLLIISLLVISEGFLFFVNLSVIDKYNRLVDSMIMEYGLVDKTYNLVESFKSVSKNIGDSDKEFELSRNRQSLENSLLLLDAEINDAESHLVFIGLQNTLKNLFIEIDHGLEMIHAGDFSDISEHNEKADLLADFVKENSNKLILTQLSYFEILEPKIDATQLLIEILAVIIFLLIVVGCVIYSISFSKKLVSPLRQLSRLARDIENGELNASVDKKLLVGDDEVAVLANSFNTMISSLRHSISQLQIYNLKIEDSQKKLKSEKNKLQQYLDVAGVIVLIFSLPDSRVQLINKKGREVLGLEAGEIIGKDWVDSFVESGSRVKTRVFLDRIYGGSNTAENTLENILITKDGQKKNIVWHITSLKDSHGNIKSILATGADVTELTSAKMTINQLREVDRVKNEVMNIATHELKTPLISIIGLSEVMNRNLTGLSDDYKKYISIIHEEGLKLNSLIKTMLSSTRSELGKTIFTSTEFNLAELILSLETSLKMLAERTKSSIVFDIQAKDVILKSDKEKIAQVIYNFVDNAVKYGAKEQKITVSLSQPDANSVKVAVTDEGKGISVENQKKMFLKFSQLEPSLSRSQEGMGLGLYICKQSIENLGGQIGVSSKLKQGSTFYFTFPITKK